LFIRSLRGFRVRFQVTLAAPVRFQRPGPHPLSPPGLTGTGTERPWPGTPAVFVCGQRVANRNYLEAIVDEYL
jgi:hypothetical protein